MSLPPSRSNTPALGIPPAETSAIEGSSEIQRLLKTVEASFVELRDASSEQSNILKASLDRLITGVEALDQQPPSSDKKTAFWTTYKKLADEFDKEFQSKYGDDLNSALIFAGLFSAVSSAFIIQIQPEFQPDPNATAVALLAMLVQNITSTVVPAMQQTGPATIVMVAQGFLYFSLFSTLLAALLAVLGKQWLLHYDSVGEKGTIEERGLERQRKLEGLRRWKFDLVMQIFPLLLQFSLLLFAVALSIYLWTINHAIAILVQITTSLAAFLYIAMVVSALLAPDSPFQTSLTALLRLVIQFQPVRSFVATTRVLLYTVLEPLRRPLSYVWSTSSAFIQAIPAVLPQFHVKNHVSPLQSPSIFDNIPQPSVEVPAVLWILETSTDPQVVEAAAAMVPDLQLPVNLDLQSLLQRLSDTFNGCFDGTQLRSGMRDRAASCIRAFGFLERLGLQEWPNLWTFDLWGGLDSELESMVSLVYFHTRGIWFPGVDITRWTLQVLPRQATSEIVLYSVLNTFRPETTKENLSLFADFLFCVNSFFVPPMARDLSVLDKGPYCVVLLTILCENLSQRLGDKKNPLELATAQAIVQRILEFKFDDYYCHLSGDHNRLRSAVHDLCIIPGLHRYAVPGLLPFVRIWPGTYNPSVLSKKVTIPSNSTEIVPWVYHLLETLEIYHTKDAEVIGDLLQLLFRYRHLRIKPSILAFETILSCLKVDTDAMTQYFAFCVLVSTDHWFQDPVLMQAQSPHVWDTLGVFQLPRDTVYGIALTLTLRPEITVHYIALGNKLSRIPAWQTTISGNLPSLLSHLPQLLEIQEPKKTTEEFCAVLHRIWGANVADDEHMEGEKPLAMAFSALGKVWDEFNSQHTGLFRLIRCTIATAFCARIYHVPLPESWSTEQWHMKNPSQKFNDIVLVRLADSLARAAEQANASEAPDAAAILSRVAPIVNGELRNRPSAGDREAEKSSEINYWHELRQGLYDLTDEHLGRQ